MAKFQNLTGRRFGRLTVISKATPSKKKIRWNCVCSCNTTKAVVIFAHALKSGHTVSCGCFKLEEFKKAVTRHGYAGNRKGKTYVAWIAMRQRCNDPKADNYSRYGGRGIKVCKRWNSFENFMKDMGESPAEMSIERKDVNGNYEPGNCRWATSKEQGRNVRTNRMLTIDGKTLCMSEWSERTGICAVTIFSRLKRGWDPKRAVFMAVHS